MCMYLFNYKYSCMRNTNFNIIHLACNCLVDTNLFPTNCTIKSFDAPKRFGHEPQIVATTCRK